MAKKIVNSVYTFYYVFLFVHSDVTNPNFLYASLIFFGIWLSGLTLLDIVKIKHI